MIFIKTLQKDHCLKRNNKKVIGLIKELGGEELVGLRAKT